MYPYGLIGNCQTAALISNEGSIDWLCMPRPDSPPIFGRILDSEGGHFSISGMGKFSGQHSYIPNTTILKTIITNEDGSQFEITDFAPRFYQHGRIYRPISLFRIVRPIKGSPTIQVSCRPVDGWTKTPVKPIRGNSHLKFELQNDFMRLVTNMSLTYLCEEKTFLLSEPLYFGLTWSTGIEEDIVSVCERFFSQTIDYWNTWVKHCSIPSLYQKETIRSALTLKLHCFEDTGAILAALTTSLPEERGQTRNWDYRFCWLRDAYFVLTAFYNLGHFEEMEGFIKFLLNIAEKHEHSRERLWPVYRLDQTLPIPEIEHPNWKGFYGSRPIRSNNQAAEHVQNDVYGEMILTLAPVFLDERFLHLRTKDLDRLLSNLAVFCAKSISKPDAGLWEIRNGWQEHSFSNLMCWAGLDRINKIQSLGFLHELGFDLSAAILSAEKAIRSACRDGSLRNGPTDDSFDSSLLQLSNLGFPDESLAKKTLSQIQSSLQLGNGSELSNFLYRYSRQDDFGRPQSAFLICSFWLIQSLARTGQIEKARETMRAVMTSANSLGLFSEHYMPNEHLQTGNFPQAYSHVGQINAAFAVSPPWGNVL